MAMTAIGLNTHLSQLIRHGINPILLRLSCWLVVALVSLTVPYLHIWQGRKDAKVLYEQLGSCAVASSVDKENTIF
jgi:hypothetical protein